MEDAQDPVFDTVPSPEALALLLAHRAEFLAFLIRRVGDRALAEDLLQSAFARLDKLATLRSDESAIAWFYRVLRNATIDHARRHKSRARTLEAFASELSTHAEPTEEVRATLCRCVGLLKDTLKPEYRDALERVELDGVAVKDYAAEAGITPNNAAVRVFRARDALRKQVSRTCGACAQHGCVDCSCERA